MRDFVLFDGGQKKLPRVHQYFGIKAAQERIATPRGRHHLAHAGLAARASSWCCSPAGYWRTTRIARVIVITDRDELDEQIEGVFADSGRDDAPHDQRARPDGPALRCAHAAPLCSLVQKFGRRDVGNFDRFIRDLEANPVRPVGELFVFVDECHRTQSGRLNRIMKAMMPGAVFIGFTGTPLLKKDRQTSLEVFGSYIHTYKYSEGVADGVVLDLVYEARDVDQELGSQDKIDAWFDAKTKGPQRLAEGRAPQAMGHDAARAELPLAHGADRQRHRLRLRHETAPQQRTRHGDAGRPQHLRGEQILRPVPEDRLQGPLRRHHVLQSAGRATSRWRTPARPYRDRQAVHLQHLYRTC